MSFDLPADHRPYTDVYFLHTRRILGAEGLNPRVTMQVFLRHGPGRVHGIDEAVAMLRQYTDLADAGGAVHALPEGSDFRPMDSIMHIEGPIQSFVELETMYLGAISSATSLANGLAAPTPDAVRSRCAAIRALCPDKRLIYFGARHWHWSLDAAITQAAVEGGFDACATEIGAQAAGLPGPVGTIPHALVIVYGHAKGISNATREATLAFDRVIEPEVPRIALIDTFNREVDDSLATATALPRLYGVRIDTAGEMVGQGAQAEAGPGAEDYWAGRGVRISGVQAVRHALDQAGHERVHIVLSSGFGNLDKLRAFAQAESRHGRLFEALGIGGVFDSWHATADIVQIEGQDFAKSGRHYTPNPAMQRML